MLIVGDDCLVVKLLKICLLMCLHSQHHLHAVDHPEFNQKSKLKEKAVAHIMPPKASGSLSFTAELSVQPPL